MAKRKAVGNKLRFEVLKRDGFTCVYCGATPLKNELKVDHVVPVSKGGDNEPSNLVAACGDCNHGKFNHLLEDKALKPNHDVKARKDHLKQIKEYLAVQKEIDKERDDATWEIADIWISKIGELQKTTFSRLKNVMETTQIPKILEAIDIVARKMGTPGEEFHDWTATKQTKYFNGILRKWRDEDGQS